MDKKELNDNLENFFSHYSKAVIYLPLVVLILVLILNFSQPQNKISYQITPTETAAKSVAGVTAIQKIDLDGPYVCEFATKDIQIKAYVKNQQALATLKDAQATRTYRIKNDCLELADRKICQISRYFSMGLNLINGNSSMIKSLVSEKLGADVDLKSLISSCQKKDFDEKKVFGN